MSTEYSADCESKNQPAHCQKCGIFWGQTVASEQCSSCNGYFCNTQGTTCFSDHECISSSPKKRTISEINKETPSTSPKKTKKNEEELYACCFCSRKDTDDDLFYCSATGCDNWFCEYDCTEEGEKDGPIINTKTCIHYCSEVCKQKTSEERKKNNKLSLNF